MRMTILMLSFALIATGCGHQPADQPAAERGADTEVVGTKARPKLATRAVATHAPVVSGDQRTSTPATATPSPEAKAAPKETSSATAPAFTGISPKEMTFGKVPTVEITGQNLEGATLLLQTEEEGMALKPVETSAGRIVLWREGAPDPLAPGTYSVVILGKDRQQVVAKNVFTVRPAVKP